MGVSSDVISSDHVDGTDPRGVLHDGRTASGRDCFQQFTGFLEDQSDVRYEILDETRGVRAGHLADAIGDADQLDGVSTNELPFEDTGDDALRDGHGHLVVSSQLLDKF